MTKIIYPANAADWMASDEYNGLFLEVGTPTLYDRTGTVMIYFRPSVDFTGSFAVMGRPRNQPTTADDIGAPFVPVGYIAVNVDGAAVDRLYSSATISGPGIIEVPAHGLSIGLLVACTAGTCQLWFARLEGATPGNLVEAV